MMKSPICLGFCVIADATVGIESPLVQGTVAVAAIAIVVREGAALVKWVLERRVGQNGEKRNNGTGARCLEHAEALARLDERIKNLEHERERR